MDSLILVGPRGSGKTVVGKILAERACIPFVDADIAFKQKHGEISTYVGERGWQEFRARETEILEEICEQYKGQRIVLAPGGGAVAHNHGELLRQRNVQILRMLGAIFYLIPYVDLEQSALTLARRVDGDSSSQNSRPALTSSDTLLDMRLQLPERHLRYLTAAHHTLYTGTKSPSEIADSICAILRKETSPQ